MAAINFGYTISKPRAIDIDRNNLRKSDEILHEMPELQACIGCGACTAVCTAGNLTEFNFRKVHTLVRRGEYQGAYEEMYREAQQRYNIHFLRGRISEASPTIDGRVQIKAEDTLTGRPLRMSVDMLVLIVGMRANDANEAFAAGAGLNRAPSGFLAPRDMFLGNVKSNVDGIFYAGTITAPKNIGESLNEGIAAADAAAKYVEA